MRGLTQVESGKDRKTFVRDAGMGSISFLSILAGTFVAFASFAVLLAIVGAILAAIGVDTASLTANDYERLGIGGAVVAALVLFLSYLFGGYIAGRLARRAGALNGGLVLLLAIVIGAVVALLVGTQTETESVAANLRVIGVPTSGGDFGTIATVAGVVTLVAMVAGAVLGGIKGERWHGKLAARAWSPDIGPAAVAHREEEEAAQRQRAREVTQHQEQVARHPCDTEAGQPAVAEQPPAGPVSEGWDETETRTWGTSSPGTPAPVGVPEGGDGAASSPQDRPRRERPLRSGRRA